MSSITEQLSSDIKDAMRARDQKKLTALRLISAAIKQIEIDERITVDDARALTVLNKLAKQRNESIAQFKVADRLDLIEQETFELTLIRQYLPEPLSDSAIKTLVDEALVKTGASTLREMNQVIAELKPHLQGRADMAVVSAMVKSRLQ